MEKKTFTELAGKKGGGTAVFIITGTDVESGRPAWWVVEVEKLKQPIIKNAKNYKQLKISDYGTILDSGFGSEAPKHIIEEYSN